LIIAGFHRSGTSATARLLHRAGLFLGYELLEALPSNPYGHFEDREIVNLHTRILADNDRTWAVDEPLLPVVGPQRWNLMQRIIDRRNSEHRLWGFKDPRACLFMMLWKHLLPDAKVLIVYRHFSNSTYSLGQRHSSDMFLGRGNAHVHRRFWEDPDFALRMWLVHNNALLAFARAFPGDTMTISMDMIRDGFPVVWALNRQWNLDLEDVPIAEAFDQSISMRRVRSQPVSDPELGKKVRDTWRRLEKLSGRTEMILREGVPVV
jgi:hypothetical protein